MDVLLWRVSSKLTTLIIRQKEYSEISFDVLNNIGNFLYWNLFIFQTFTAKFFLFWINKFSYFRNFNFPSYIKFKYKYMVKIVFGKHKLWPLSKELTSVFEIPFKVTRIYIRLF